MVYNSCKGTTPFELADLIAIAGRPTARSVSYQALGHIKRSNETHLLCPIVHPRQLYPACSARVERHHPPCLQHRPLDAGLHVHTSKELIYSSTQHVMLTFCPKPHPALRNS